MLAVGAVHHHLIQRGMRMNVKLTRGESGEPRDVHHFAALIGYGANAICPYLLYETIDDMIVEGRHLAGITPAQAYNKLWSRPSIKGCSKGDEQDGHQHPRQLLWGANF